MNCLQLSNKKMIFKEIRCVWLVFVFSFFFYLASMLFFFSKGLRKKCISFELCVLVSISGSHLFHFVTMLIHKLNLVFNKKPGLGAFEPRFSMVMTINNRFIVHHHFHMKCKCSRRENREQEKKTLLIRIQVISRELKHLNNH